jgi:hypothetical protein
LSFVFVATRPRGANRSQAVSGRIRAHPGKAVLLFDGALQHRSSAYAAQLGQVLTVVTLPTTHLRLKSDAIRIAAPPATAVPARGATRAAGSTDADD